jgi:hypothetical protein
MGKAARHFGFSTAFVLLFLGSLARAQFSPVPLINQPPVPDTAAPGGPGFTLTVNGPASLRTLLWSGTELNCTPWWFQAAR